MKMSAKIYLAKSNKANPNIVMSVREKLSKYDIEIVEYTGGHYSHDELLKCEFLIVIPDMTTLKVSGKNESRATVIVGKGLYDQITSFYSYKTNNKIGVIVNTDLNITRFYDSDTIDSTDYINYGKILVRGRESFLEYMTDTVNVSEKKLNLTKNKSDNHLSITL